MPAKFRGGLADGMFITRGFEHCLILWPMQEWRLITEKLRELSLMNADSRRLVRLFTSGAADATADRLGRILIPSSLREYAGLSDAAVVVGVLDRVEIWSRDAWSAERSTTEAEGAQIAEHLFSQGLRS